MSSISLFKISLLDASKSEIISNAFSIAQITALRRFNFIPAFEYMQLMNTFGLRLNHLFPPGI